MLACSASCWRVLLLYHFHYEALGRTDISKESERSRFEELFPRCFPGIRESLEEKGYFRILVRNLVSLQLLAPIPLYSRVSILKLTVDIKILAYK